CFKDAKWVRMPDPTQPDFRADWRGSFLTADCYGALWLPAGRNGIHRYLNGEFQFLPMPHAGEEDYVLCIYSDREGNLWFGMESSGLQRWTPREAATYTAHDGLADDNVWTICQARDGRLLVGTDKGITVFKDGHFTRIESRQDSPEAYVRSVVEDRDGALWIGTT